MALKINSRSLLSLTILTCFILRLVNAQDDGDTLWFYSRPDLTPPALHVSISEDGTVPGYIFMAPYQTEQDSAVIYDTKGQLIWSGYGVTGGGSVQAFHVCNYKQTDHLCFFNGEQGQGYGRGHIEVFNTNFTSVAAVRAQNVMANLDMHENRLTSNGKSIYVTSYHPERYDLSDYDITTGEGWIQNVIVQRIDIATGALLWEWSAIEHVALAESYVLPNASEVAGTGFSAASPWDYIHVNSADENDDGDVLISARHVNTVFKVSGEDGSVIWRLGGKHSDFELEDFIFSSQHDARWKSSNASTDIITLFDNASNGYESTAEASSGMIIKLNHSTDPPRATLLQSFPAPEGITISSSQGNVQLLGNNSDWATSNAFIGWGSQPYVTEHLPNGTVIYQANVNADGPMNYRAFKFNLTTNPRENPALYTYARSSDSGPTVFYMSWNGATEVARWRVYGRGSCNGDWTEFGTVDKDGFEMSYQVDGYWEFGLVEALDSEGNGLRNSSTRGVKTFVPKSVLLKSCDESGCGVATEYVRGDGDQVAMDTRPGCSALVSNGISDSSFDDDGSGSGSGSGSGNGSENLATRGVVGWTTLMIVAGFAIRLVAL